MPRLLDPPIRVALLNHLRRQYPRGVIFNEFTVDSLRSRIDVVVVGADKLHGYEIKSDGDVFGARYEKQRVSYEGTFDTLTIVTTLKHADSVRRCVPASWGIVYALDGVPDLLPIRQPSGCDWVAPITWAMLLWREEALTALTRRGIDRGFRGARRRDLHQRLVEKVPFPTLRRIVCAALKQRSLERRLLTPVTIPS